MKSKLLNFLLFSALIALVAAAAIFRLREKPIDFQSFLPAWSPGQWVSFAVSALVFIAILYIFNRKRRR